MLRFALYDVPAIIVFAEPHGGLIMLSRRIKRRANLVKRGPSPSKVDIRLVVLLADAVDANQFMTGDGNREGRFARVIRGNERPDGVNAGGSQIEFPAGRRSNSGWTRRVRGVHPAMLLQNQKFRRGIFLARDDSGLNQEFLRCFERWRCGDQIRRESAREKILRRAGDTEQQGEY